MKTRQSPGRANVVGYWGWIVGRDSKKSAQEIYPEHLEESTPVRVSES